jgi:hypothetical protein
LVNDSALCPIRGDKIFGNAAYLPAITSFNIGIVPLLKKAEAVIRLVNAEMIEEKAGGIKGKFAFVNGVKPILPQKGHGYGKSHLSVFPAENTFYTCGRNGSGNMNMKGADLLWD